MVDGDSWTWRGGFGLGFVCCLLLLLENLHLSDARSNYKRYFLDEFCRRKQGELDIGDKNSVLLQLRSTSLRYEPNMDCWLRIRGHENQVMVLKFLRLSLYDVGYCIKNKLLIYENTIKNISLLGGPYCGYHQQPEKVTTLISHSNVISLHFYCKATSHMSGFTLLITPAIMRDRCTEKEFPCNSEPPWQCIHSSLLCDGKDNCGNMRDERTESAACGVMSVRAIVSTMVVIVAVLVVTAAFVSLLYRKKK